MWKDLPESHKQEYKRMILAFASLTEMFAQKAENEDEKDIKLSPIINSKYQETVFQRAFFASAEDIGNTSYDAAIKSKLTNGKEIKYLIGIKTFGINSGYQKIAQFKANITEWASLINQIRENAKNADGSAKTKEEINEVNHDLYMKLARKISELRNIRIRSSISNLQGFEIDDEKDEVESVYHVLMPSKKGDDAKIYVGEMSYTEIDLDNLEIKGCTSARNPINFEFYDQNHTYRYTAADSQLLMDFINKEIVQDEWEVVYADDAYQLFSNLADDIYGKAEIVPKIVESYCWKIVNNKGEVERFSGLNNFYGVGSKLGANQREGKIKRFEEKYSVQVDKEHLTGVVDRLYKYLITEKGGTTQDKIRKAELRDEILKIAKETKNNAYILDVEKIVYRAKYEVYIPISNAKQFHMNNPDFFGKNIGTFKEKPKSKLALPAKEREFDLVFEPSGTKIRAFITQDNGKGIESVDKQEYLGKWILRDLFQLDWSYVKI